MSHTQNPVSKWLTMLQACIYPGVDCEFGQTRSRPSDLGHHKSESLTGRNVVRVITTPQSDRGDWDVEKTLRLLPSMDEFGSEPTATDPQMRWKGLIVVVQPQGDADAVGSTATSLARSP